MARHGKPKTKHPDRTQTGTGQAQAPPPGSAGSGQAQAAPPPSGWVQAKRPILQFVLMFGVFMGLFYLVMTRPLLKERAFPAYLDWNASASTRLLNLFGQEATVSGKSIDSSRGSIQVMRGCDAVEPTALFVAAVLATPVTAWAKLLGALGGTVLLAVINLARIVTLFLTRIYFPKAFEVMHVEIWQGLFICLSLVLWIAWALWATKPKAVKGDAST